MAEYSLNITKMMAKLNKLRQEYPKMVKQTAQQIAIANMMECKDDYFVNVSMGNTDTGFLTMMGTEERRENLHLLCRSLLEGFLAEEGVRPGDGRLDRPQNDSRFLARLQADGDSPVCEMGLVLDPLGPCQPG